LIVGIPLIDPNDPEEATEATRAKMYNIIKTIKI
jgi:hypothetical protein